MLYTYIILGWLSVVAIFQGVKPLPPGVNYLGDEHFIADSSMEFLVDLTFRDSLGETQHQQQIFHTVFSYIDSAQKYILIDMFLFNSHKGPAAWSLNELSADLSKLLIQKKQSIPDIQIDFITDPVNTLYGGVKLPELEAMQQAGINTIVSDLTKLRDSNPLYSPLWRTGFQWLGNTAESGFLTNIFDGDLPRVTLRSYLAFLNLKANHRKIFVADCGDEMVSIITSANPHSASADFSNIGVLVKGELWRDIYDSEMGLAQFSDSKLSGEFFTRIPPQRVSKETGSSIQLITEGKIRNALLHHFEASTTDDTIKIAMFYMSNRKIVKSLLHAADRGVIVRLILDPNKDGFGFHHNGTPNRPVVKELLRKSKGQIDIRWFHTHGEQFHAKVSLIKKQEGQHVVILGSANMTRKNLDNYNLEANILLQLDRNTDMAEEIDAYLDMLWYNQGENYTTDVATFNDAGLLKSVLYRIQEFTGLSTY
ncbi:MAG: phospholipase [FCB group bacterium]|nr:phospholipase [FCB group bacterium]